MCANYSSNTVTPITLATDTPGTAISISTNPYLLRCRAGSGADLLVYSLP